MPFSILFLCIHWVKLQEDWKKINNVTIREIITKKNVGSIIHIMFTTSLCLIIWLFIVSFIAGELVNVTLSSSILQRLFNLEISNFDDKLYIVFIF